MMGAIVGAVLWALSSSAGVANAAATPPAAAPLPASASAGCGKIGRHSTGIFKWTTADGRNRTRTLLIQVPADYSPSKTYSLNFVFHGAGGNSAQSYSWGLQNVSGASDNGIFVFPEGIAYRNEGVGWDDTTNGYDLPFFDNMVKDVETDFCIDTARVFVAGFSWGGDFVIALVCNPGTTVRAAAANSSTDEYQDKTNYLTYQDLPCATTAHPPVRYEHAVGGDPSYPAPFFATTSKLLQHLNSCAATSTAVASSTAEMACVSYDGCKSAVIECSFNASIGHALPPNWAKDTWAFFSTFK